MTVDRSIALSSCIVWPFSLDKATADLSNRPSLFHTLQLHGARKPFQSRNSHNCCPNQFDERRNSTDQNQLAIGYLVLVSKQLVILFTSTESFENSVSVRLCMCVCVRFSLTSLRIFWSLGLCYVLWLGPYLRLNTMVNNKTDKPTKTYTRWTAHQFANGLNVQ